MWRYLAVVMKFLRLTTNTAALGCERPSARNAWTSDFQTRHPAIGNAMRLGMGDVSIFAVTCHCSTCLRLANAYNADSYHILLALMHRTGRTLGTLVAPTPADDLKPSGISLRLSSFSCSY